MKTLKVAVILVSLLLVSTSLAEAKRKRNKSSDTSSPGKTKTKTKWTTSTDLGENAQNAMIATEEHGYYVKRTFLPLSGSKNDTSYRSPPFLAVPIAWFACANADECAKFNSMAINSNQNSLSQGFLCDDDCLEGYEPVCGKTATEVAVFYNKCKLNVAKCRSHGLWTELPYEECKKQYPEEVKYADIKFRANPFFKENKVNAETLMKPTDSKQLEMEATESKQLEMAATDNKQQDREVNSSKSTQAAVDAVVMIKEIQEEEPQEKVKDSKDHYVEVKPETNVTSEDLSKYKL